MSAWEQNLEQLAQELVRGDEAPDSLVQKGIEAAGEREEKLRALALLEAERARNQARELPVSPVGEQYPLYGLPYVAQDDLCTSGVVTAYGSRFLESYRPPFSATVVERAEAAGAVRVGKAAVPEFVLGENPRGTANPLWPDRLAGVGADGAAAAVAGGMAAFALGGDTMGSLRSAAASCGLSALKPTYGRVSRYGLLSVAASLEQVAVVAPTPADCGQVYAAIAGKDPADATTTSGDRESHREAGETQPLAIGLIRPENGTWPLGAEVEEALERSREMLEASGARVEPVSLAGLEHASTAALAIAWAEASSELSNLDGVRFGHQEPAEHLQQMYRRSRAAGLGSEVKAALVGGFVLTTEELGLHHYWQATRVRTAIKRGLEQLLSVYDLLLLPAIPGEPPLADGSGPLPELQLQQWSYTAPASLSGCPALCLPGKGDNEFPAGVQLLAAPWREDLLLETGQLWPV